MNLRHLEIFRAVLASGSATKAARTVGISQPAVSRILARFERDMGITLFKREGGGLVPTPEALTLGEEVERACAGVDGLLRRAKGIREMGEGHLRVASIPSLANVTVPRILAALTRRHPGLRVTAEVRTTPGVLESAAAKQIDVGIVTQLGPVKGVEIETLAVTPSMAVLPRHHPLAARPVIRPEDLETVPFIPVCRRHQARQRIDEVLARAGVRPRRRIEVTTGALACALVAEGVGVSILSAMTIRDNLNDRIVVRPFAPEIRNEFGFAFPADRPRSRLTLAFVEGLREEFAAAEPWDLSA
ncbi:MAG: LysR family transcriptional regulator [Hyphomicrobiales bacterium]|nr:LysR family transcriptional regulator [Hyphomicrobiales bacterium]MCP5372415.1 LysR family transcriptional regulator [Hyphomicrobiales bacterium]